MSLRDNGINGKGSRVKKYKERLIVYKIGCIFGFSRLGFYGVDVEIEFGIKDFY